MRFINNETVYLPAWEAFGTLICDGSMHKDDVDSFEDTHAYILLYPEFRVPQDNGILCISVDQIAKQYSDI